MVFQDYALFPHMTVAENVGVRPQAEARRPRRAALPRRGDARRRPPRGPRRRATRRALRRPAPARRPRPRPRQPAGCAAARRAARRSRPEASSRDAVRAQADPEEHRHHVRLRHPRPGGGADDVGSDRRHGRRPGSAARRPEDALRTAADVVRRRLHRHLERDRWSASTAARASTRSSSRPRASGSSFRRLLGRRFASGQRPAGEDHIRSPATVIRPQRPCTDRTSRASRSSASTSDRSPRRSSSCPAATGSPSTSSTTTTPRRSSRATP